jgi:hypothetical protein
MKLRSLVPNFYIQLSVCERFIFPTIDLQTQHSQISGLIVGIYKSFTDT